MQETPLEQHQPPPRMLGFNARPKVAAPEEAAVAPAAVKAKLAAGREQSPASVSSQSLASPAFSASQTTLLVPGSAQHETTLGNVSGGSVRTLADGTLPLQQQQPYPPAGPALRLATGRPASQSLTFVPRPGLSAAMTMASTTAGGQSAAGLHTASSQDIFQSRIAASVLKLVRRMILGRLADDEQVVAEVDTVIVKLYQYCLRILGSRIMPHFLNDEAHIVDLIKKKRMLWDGRRRTRCACMPDNEFSTHQSCALTHPRSVRCVSLVSSESWVDSKCSSSAGPYSTFSTRSARMRRVSNGSCHRTWRM